jgi:hypothetical protein
MCHITSPTSSAALHSLRGSIRAMRCGTNTRHAPFRGATTMLRRPGATLRSLRLPQDDKGRAHFTGQPSARCN